MSIIELVIGIFICLIFMLVIGGVSYAAYAAKKSRDEMYSLILREISNIGKESA